MSEQREVINQALDLASTGAIEDACQKLWPLVREAEGREEALFTMACCFERANQLPPAAYLFGWVAERYPDFAPATERSERCKRQMAERGLHEDFRDSGHVACAACTLRYRAELPMCPYCGGKVASSAATLAAPPLPEEPQSRELLDEIGANLDRAWKNVQHRFNEFTEEPGLTGTSLRIQELAREARNRTRNFAESDRGKRLHETVSRFGDEAGKRAREFTQNEKIKKVVQQSREIGEDAIDRVKAVASRDEVKSTWQRVEDVGHETTKRVESWATSDETRSTWQRIYASAERVIANLQRGIDQITGRKPDEAEKRGEDPASAPVAESEEPRKE